MSFGQVNLALHVMGRTCPGVSTFGQVPTLVGCRRGLPFRPLPPNPPRHRSFVVALSLSDEVRTVKTRTLAVSHPVSALRVQEYQDDLGSENAGLPAHRLSK